MPAIDFNGLDTAVHGPLRLGVLTILQTQGGTTFTHLRDALSATDGALGMHLQKLEQTGYIACQKAFVDRKPRSTYTITSAGRAALLKYVETLEAIVALLHATPDTPRKENGPS